MTTVRVLAHAGCAALALVPSVAVAQQRVPVVDLPVASAKSTEFLGTILGVRQLADGRVLVNDGGRRQVRLFDADLAKSVVVLDSVLGVPNSYGPRRAALIAYLADSSLFSDIVSQTILVLDANGRVARTMSLPNPFDIYFVSGSASSSSDDRGRLVYTGAPARPSAGQPNTALSDSSPILRADLDARRVDTIARVSQPTGTKTRIDQGVDGKMSMTRVVNPLQAIDDWALLSDGSVAIVRGHDYHIDWIGVDGATHSTGKLQFDWRRLTDDDKQKLLDSTRSAQDSARVKAAEAIKGAPSAASAVTAQGELAAMMAMRGGVPRAGPEPPNLNLLPAVEYVPLKDIADYYPPIRIGATKADLDGNLWILPTTSAQSVNGALVYDVVNMKHELFKRVRVPAGRLIVGFGKGGVVYLSAFDRVNGFSLERIKLDVAP